MRPAGHEKVHGGGRGREVVAEVLGEGFEGRFGGVVGRVAGGVGDALFGAGDDDGGGVGEGEEGGEEGGDAVDGAEEVRVHDLWGFCVNFLGGWGGLEGKEVDTLWKYSVSSHPLLSMMPAFSMRKSTRPKRFSTFVFRSFHSTMLLTSMG